MSNTVSVDISTDSFPTIGNYLKYAIYEYNGTVQVAERIFAPAHPARTVTFPGLNRANYKFKLLETSDSAGLIVIRQKGGFDVIPADNSIKYKEPFYLQVDVTPNVVNGTTTFTQDGTAGTQDWRGFTIQADRIGIGPMKPGIDFNWNKNTGKFDLLVALDVFQPSEFFKIEFDIINNVAAGVPTANLFSGVVIVNNNRILSAADAGKKILIKGSVSNLNITLPNISLVQDGLPFYFESGRGNHIIASILAAGTDRIDWITSLRTDIKICRCENITIYKNTDPADLAPYWRVHEANGNFLTVGRQFESDGNAANSINSVEMDGSLLSTADYSRLYEYVLNLPPSQVVNFTDWASNKTKFSFASGGLFQIPDRRGLVSKANEPATSPGDYQPDMVGPITGSATLTHANGYTGGPNNQFFGNGFNVQENKVSGIFINTGNAETTVKNYRIKKYILI